MSQLLIQNNNETNITPDVTLDERFATSDKIVSDAPEKLDCIDLESNDWQEY